MKREQRYNRREFLAMAGRAGAAVALAGFPALVRAKEKTRSVIVLGIDGMDPALLQQYWSEGRLPNSRRLKETGGFSLLRTSDPPQSPVAWSNFISGTNPGGHGLFDFIARDAATLQPRFSMARVEPPARILTMGRHIIPLSGPRIANLRQGPTFWVELEKQGIECTVLRMPANFPPTSCAGRTLAGMGTPDIRGGYGTFTVWTDESTETTREVAGGRICRVTLKDNAFESELPGPANTLDTGHGEVRVPFAVHIDREHAVAKVTIQGQELLLNEGEWSEWIPVRFTLAPVIATCSGICRFFLKRAREPFTLYVSPVNLNPAEPASPLSTPASYVRDLAKALGSFHTQGIAEDTHALSAGVFSDDDYRGQATFVFEEQQRLFEHEFARFREGFFFSYFSALDLNSHAFWRALDTEHPLYTPELARRHGDFIPWLYERMDALIGMVLAQSDERTLVMVMSDHGFAPFRRQFNLNGWLMDYGYARPQPGAVRGETALFGDTDWRETRAYGLGLNGLYLNIKGREQQGCVTPGLEAERLTAELIRHLTTCRDPADGEKIISHVYRPGEIYTGAHVNEAPDLIVCYKPPYRASWDTALGCYGREQVLDNKNPWSGDHAMDSAYLPGVLLANRAIQNQAPTLCELAPTIMAAFGMAPAVGMTGKVVEFGHNQEG